MLAKARYSRLIDIFLGTVTYSHGSHHVIPLQAKDSNDIFGIIRTIQDIAFCQSEDHYRYSICRLVSAQFLDADTIALFETVFDGRDVSIKQERHYRLTSREGIVARDLEHHPMPES